MSGDGKTVYPLSTKAVGSTTPVLVVNCCVFTSGSSDCHPLVLLTAMLSENQVEHKCGKDTAERSALGEALKFQEDFCRAVGVDLVDMFVVHIADGQEMGEVAV